MALLRRGIRHLSTWLVISLLWLPIWLHAQEMLGLHQSNYSGVNTILSNPAMLTNTRNYLEVNIFGMGFFNRNTAVYIPGSDYSIWKALRGDPLPTYGDDERNILYYQNQRTKLLVNNLRVLGPSAMIQLGDHAFALSSQARVLVSGNNIPWEMPVFGVEGLNFTPLQNINFNDNQMDFVTAEWWDIGLSYAYNVYQYLDTRVTVGVTVRKLWAYSGAYGDIQNVDYMVLNDSTINIKNLKGEIGMALPVDYDNTDFPDGGATFKGSGMGLDIGAVYIKQTYVGSKRFKRLCGQRYEDYIYRIGVSILDIGRIKYTDNAQKHSYDDVSVFWQNFDTLNFNSINRTIADFSNLFYGDPDASYRADNFTIGLPTALSVQADYHFQGYDFYLGAFWIHPIQLNGHSLRRPAQLALTPRYESKFLDVSVPISLYEYRYMRVGLSARFYFVTVGTERLGTWLGMGDLNGLDFYFAFKFTLGKGSCRKIKEGACANGEFGYSDKDKARFRKRRR